MNEANSQQPLRDKLFHELFLIWPKENIARRDNTTVFARF